MRQIKSSPSIPKPIDTLPVNPGESGPRSRNGTTFLTSLGRLPVGAFGGFAVTVPDIVLGILEGWEQPRTGLAGQA